MLKTFQMQLIILGWWRCTAFMLANGMIKRDLARVRRKTSGKSSRSQRRSLVLLGSLEGKWTRLICDLARDLERKDTTQRRYRPQARIEDIKY